MARSSPPSLLPASRGWAGSEYGFPPCYGKLDLFADGTFGYDFVDYG